MQAEYFKCIYVHCTWMEMENAMRSPQFDKNERIDIKGTGGVNDLSK